LRDLGYNVIERNVLVDELFIADELFFVGTAAEVTPIKELDGQTFDTSFGKKVYEEYMKVVRGENKKYEYWLDYI